MQKKHIKKLWYFLVLPLSFIAIVIILLTIFEYTRVADIRESLSNVNQEDSISYGKVLFETRGCSSCHAIKSGKDSLGPNLSGIGKRKSEDYIKQSIENPSAIVVAGYEDISMPNFGEILNQKQVKALVMYISRIE